MATQQYKLKGVTSLKFSDGQKEEAEVEGIENGKVLLIGHGGQVHATSPNCTHYGAPLKNGVVSSDGRLTCPWHGGTFTVLEWFLPFGTTPGLSGWAAGCWLQGADVKVQTIDRLILTHAGSLLQNIYWRRGRCSGS